MASQITSNGQSLEAQAATPSIRTFQIDPNGLGAIAESVNLFRGDVNVPLDLVSINSRAGIQASATVIYQSNLQDAVDTWNLDAPTGPLGLGWWMGYEFIARDDRPTVTPNQATYFLVANGGSTPLYQLEITDEYRSYQAAGHNFWQIRYYPADELWEVIKEDDYRYRYGGRAEQAETGALQVGVKWSGERGNWIGSTIESSGQAHLPVAWNLASIRTAWGDGIDYQYENVQVPIGKSSGLEYTRASRLVRVGATDGQSITFHYLPKEHNNQAREYQIPHLDPTSPELHAYQDRFETGYLDAVRVWSAAGERITEARFTYNLVNMSLDHQGDPDYVKRYLNGITMCTGDGLPLPGFHFTYHNDPEDELDASVPRGVLRRIGYPQGGEVSYTYARTVLAGTDRATSLTTLHGSTRVWFGPDYTVLTEYDGSQRGLTVSIYSWNGLWVKSPSEYQFPRDIDLESLQVSPEAAFFAIGFREVGTSPRYYTLAFHKEDGRYGQWHSEQQPWTLDAGHAGTGHLATGNRFIVAIASGGDYLARVWDPRRKEWLDRSSSLRIDPSSQYALAAGNDFATVAAYRESDRSVGLSLWYLDDADLEFHAAKLARETLARVIWDAQSTPEQFWTLGPNFAVSTFVTNQTDDRVDYQLLLQQWDMDFSARLEVDKAYHLPLPTHLPFTQTVAGGSVVGNVTHLFRYDGVKWQEGELPDVPDAGKAPRFVYGSDAAVASNRYQIANETYNPFLGRWEQPRTTSGTEIVPTLSGDYLTLGRDVYYRTNEGELRLVHSLDAGLNPDSLVNRAPYFLAFEDDGGSTHVLPLRNGGVVTAEEEVLKNQRIYVPEGGPGTHLVGPASLVTYTGQSFDAPSALYLYQFVDRKLRGNIECFAVLGLSIDDGYPSLWGAANGRKGSSSRFYYDCDHVTVSPGGVVAEFAAATTVYGADSEGGTACYPPPDETPYGRSEFRYHNDRSPREAGLVPEDGMLGSAAYYYSYLNGMIFDRTDYDAAGNPVERVLTLYSVRTEYEPIDAPGVRLPLVAGYVRSIATETSYYEQLITAEALPEAANGSRQVPPELVRSFAAHGIDVEQGMLVPSGAAGRWQLYADPTRPTYLPLVLEGDQVRAAVAVERAVRNEYSWATGLLVSDSTESYNAWGRRETNSRQIYYGWQVPEYHLMRQHHLWSPVALSIRFTQYDDEASPGTPTALSITTYQLWEADGQPDGVLPFAPRRSYTAVSEASYQPSLPLPVDFSDWGNNDPPPVGLWVCVGEVTVRAATGPVLESVDVGGSPNTVVLDRSAQLQLAQFMNADRQECSFAGFERYETYDGWHMSSGRPLSDRIIEGDAHTGTRCLPLLPEVAFLERTFSLRTGERYLLTCWVKTSPGFDADSGWAGWTAVVDGETRATFEVEGTDLTWEFRSFVLLLEAAPGGPERLPVSLRFQNTKSDMGSWLRLDDVIITPLLSTADARTYNTRYAEIEAEVGPGGETRRNVLDTFQSVACDANAGVVVSSCVVPYQCKASDAAPRFVFPAHEPNSVVSVAPSAGGRLANLIQGGEWRREWSGADLAQWEVRDGRLMHPVNGAGEITFEPSQGQRNCGARFSVQLRTDDEGNPIVPVHAVGLAVGSTVSVTWEPTSGWTLRLGTRELQSSVEFATEWLLLAPVDPVTGQQAVLFFANGRQLFAELDTEAVVGALQLRTADPTIGFFGIATLRSPRLSISYVDGSGKERQQQTFTGTGIQIAGSLYDPIGRSAVGVKQCLLPGVAPGYRADFVESFDPVTGVLTGLAAACHPEDGGYPYVRTEFFRTAQSLAHRQGLPGTQFALRGGSAGENPHVTTYRYGTNVQGTFDGEDWPSHQYFVKEMTDQNGSKTYTVTTKTDQEVGAIEALAAGEGFRINQFYYDRAGRLSRSLPPEGVRARQAGDRDADGWATERSYDFAGNLLSQTEPDSGTIQYVYDLAGRIRFALDAEGNDPDGEQDTILYTKYDRLGRTIEEGLFVDRWDRALLEERAKDPAWPGTADPHTPTSISHYDGDGSDPTLLGQLSRAETINPETGETVREIYTYDLAGNVKTKTLVAETFDEIPRQVAYAYNNLNETVWVTYPEGASVPKVVSEYDLLGQVVRLGTPANPDEFGVFRYDASGQLVDSHLRPGAASALRQLVAFNPPGWPLDIRYTPPGASSLFHESLTYTERPGGQPGYFDGKIAQAEVRLGSEAETTAYNYDAVSQLTAAAEAGAGATLGAAYDLNGNIDSLTVNAGTFAYRYEAGTDRLQEVTAGGAVVDAYTYNRNGAVTSATRRDIAAINYDPTQRKADRIRMGEAPTTGQPGAEVCFQYESSGARVLKRVLDSGGTETAIRLYVTGSDPQPLFETIRKAGAAEELQLIYGPGGLVALETPTGRFVVVTDHLGSIRQVVDGQGDVVATFHYSAFGVTVEQTANSQSGFFYRFTGQEFDEETGLYNYNARFYDPELGRFLDVDPARDGGSPYIYVRNNPVSLVDPTGEEPLTAFLLLLLISVIIGAVAGAVTYAVSYEGNFNVGKFFLYTVVGAAAAGVGAAAGYGAGLLATAVLATAGVSTSTSIASGIVVGAITGAADGVVASTLNQVGVNLIEHEDPGKGLKGAALMGLAIGAGAGAVAGGITGALNRSTALRLKQPDAFVGQTKNGRRYATFRGVPNGRRYGYNNLGGANGGLGADEVLGIGGHGRKSTPSIRFVDQKPPPIGARKTGTEIVNGLGGAGNFRGKGIDLSMSCYGGRSGMARQLATDLRVPVRAANVPVIGAKRVGFGRVRGQAYIAWWRKLFQGGTFRTYYPSKTQTAWIALFGY